jgi:S1-C subfamily serine protease
MAHDETESDADLTYRGRLALCFILVVAALALLLASCDCRARVNAPRTYPIADAEYDRTVRVEVSCIGTDDKSALGIALSESWGSGVRVGGTIVLTAAHVVDCMSAGKQSALVIAVVDSGNIRHIATLEAATPADVARLNVSDLAPLPPVAIAQAVRGERACATFAVPEPGRRCGEVWANRARPPGDIHIDYVSEHGNSGGPLWSPAGELLGIVVYLHWCQGTDGNKQVCTAGATSLWGRSWLAAN